MKKCLKCGTENEATSLFCAECGTHLDTTLNRFNPSAEMPDEEETQLSFRSKVFDHAAKTISIAQQDALTMPHNPTLPINPVIVPDSDTQAESTTEITTSWFTQYNLTMAAVIVVVLWLGCVIVGLGGAGLAYFFMLAQ